MLRAEAEGIYPDAEGTSGLSTQKEQSLESPTEHSSVALVQTGIETPPERNLLPSAFS